MYYILLAITAYNLFIGFRYIIRLENMFKNGRYIYGDYMHSLQHIATVWITAVISVSMTFWVVSDYTMLIYLIYNASLSFIIYPHLISEE